LTDDVTDSQFKMINILMCTLKWPAYACALCSPVSTCRVLT